MCLLKAGRHLKERRGFRRGEKIFSDAQLTGFMGVLHVYSDEPVFNQRTNDHAIGMRDVKIQAKVVLIGRYGRTTECTVFEAYFLGVELQQSGEE